MTGMTINEFTDKVYYGDEIEFKIGDMTYFVQGAKKNGKYWLSVDYWHKTDGTEPPHDYLFEIYCNSPEERLEKFEEAEIFDGKCIYDVESKIEVLYG